MALTDAQRKAYEALMDLQDYMVSANTRGFRGTRAQQEAKFEEILAAFGGATPHLLGYDQQPDLEHDTISFHRDADNSARSLALKNLGVYVLPTASGHAPDLTDATVGQAYVDLNIPCIVGSQVLYARRELVGAHGARAVWAPINSEPNDMDVGDEIVAAWSGAGVEYKVGDRVDAGSGSTLSVCVQDHTSTLTGATGDPDDENTGYEAYWNNLGSVATRRITFAGFRGVTTDPSNVNMPRDGEWVYDIFQGIPYAARYLAGSMIWNGFDASSEGIHNMLGNFANAEEALNEVHFFSTSQRTAAIIDGQLNILTYWDPPAAGMGEYHWRSRASSPTAPFLLATREAADVAAKAYVTIADVYQTLLDLDANWVYIEVTDSGRDHVQPFPWIRVGALREIDPTDVNFLNFTMVEVSHLTGNNESSDNACGIGVAYDGDDLVLRAESAVPLDGQVDVYAIR